MITPQDIAYLKLAIENSRKSFEEGRFPAGGVDANSVSFQILN